MNKVDVVVLENQCDVTEEISVHSESLFLWALCSSRKYPYPPHGRLMEIPRGRGVSKAKFLE